MCEIIDVNTQNLILLLIDDSLSKMSWVIWLLLLMWLHSDRKYKIQMSYTFEVSAQINWSFDSDNQLKYRWPISYSRSINIQVNLLIFSQEESILSMRKLSQKSVG